MPWDWLTQNQPSTYTGDMLTGINQALPSIVNQINSSMYPTGWAGLQASQQLSPGFQNLMNQMFANYAPGLNATGSAINNQNLQAQMQAQNNAVTGAGGQYLSNVNNLVRNLNPEYFGQLGGTSDQLNRLFGSIDLSGKLSGGEQTEIERGLNREGLQRGDLNAPNQTSTVSNAMQYGQAARARQVQSQGILSDAIAKATQFLSQASPSAGTGINAGTVTGNTNGSTVMPNQGASNFMGIYQPSNSTGQNAMSQFLQGFNANQMGSLGLWGQMNMNQQNINANKKDWLDMVEQGTQAFKNVAGGAGGIMGGM